MSGQRLNMFFVSYLFFLLFLNFNLGFMAPRLYMSLFLLFKAGKQVYVYID